MRGIRLVGIRRGDFVVNADANRHEINLMQQCIESFYTDMVFPEAQMVFARLKDLGLGLHILAVSLDFYKMQPAYVVTTDESGRTSILLKRGFPGFKGWINPCDGVDRYPVAMWEDFGKYLDGLKTESPSNNTSPLVFTFQRGRYGTAKALYERQLPFFEGYALGEIIHIVELGIKKGLLRYAEDGLLIPASARRGVPNDRRDHVKTTDELKQIFAGLFRKYPNGFNLSTLKNKFKAHFQKRLCETAVGDMKLLTLVTSPLLGDVVNVVRLEGDSGYFCKPTDALVLQLIAEQQIETSHSQQGQHGSQSQGGNTSAAVATNNNSNRCGQTSGRANTGTNSVRSPVNADVLGKRQGYADESE
ncbi:unnamed protein product [Amoebophrya sp. A25]|nr:unnamed protein product [Amoebophrya sp. A25]|eukprot:GSA25T00003749001.1